jgi:protein TonB
MPRRSVVAVGLAVAMLMACRRPEDAKTDPVSDSMAAPASATSQVFMDSVLEEKPELLRGPTLRYPAWLAEAGIEGRVIVQLILDTLGRAEPTSLNVIQTPNAGFDQPAMNYVLRARFRPGLIHGRPVRVLLNLPIDFNLTREQP